MICDRLHGSSSLPSGDVEGRLPVRGTDSMVGPYWGTL
jgi:hypothetical protein